MNHELHAAIERIEAHAWEGMCRHLPPDVAETLKVWVGRYGQAVATRCLVSDSSLTNRVVALGCGGEDPSEEELAQWVEEYRSTDLQNFAFQLNPEAEKKLGSSLVKRGLAVRNHNMKLHRGHSTPTQTPQLEIRRVSTEQKSVFGETSALGFGRPPIIAHWMASTVGQAGWQHYLAYVEGEAAGAAAIYVEGDFAWLGIGSTRPEFRQRGVQQALIAQRITDGLALGVRHFTAETESRNVSCQNLVKQGFVVVYERPNYGLPQSGS